MVQLAGEKSVFIFQLKKCGFEAELIKLLSNHLLTKCGVAVDHDIKDLQKRKETQLAIEDYNNHISNQIKPNGQFPSGLFVRFLLTIIPSGEIIKFEFIEVKFKFYFPAMCTQVYKADFHKIISPYKTLVQ